MVDRVSREPQGPGQWLLLQNSENLFNGWKKVSVQVTPSTLWGAVSHIEAGDFNSPGDAPIFWGLSTSGIPAGTQVASTIYERDIIARGRAGQSWSDPTQLGLSTAPSVTPSGEDGAWTDILGRTQDEILASTDPAGIAGSKALGHSFTKPSDKTTLFGVLKGISRWGILAFDAIPESIDAVLRAADYTSDGTLSFGEAFGGIVGLGTEESRAMTGVPLFQYLRSGLEGDRLNMGTGWFAQGDVAADIQEQLDQYNLETESLTQDDFDRMEAQMGGQLRVQGLGGKEFWAKNLEELKFLRQNAGQAALLHSLQGTSAEQNTLGVAHGAFQEQVYDEASMLRHGGTSNGAYFANSAGRVTGSLIDPAQGFAYQVVSAGVDLGKQLVDLNLLGLAGRGRHIVNGANKYIAAGGEAADLLKGSQIMNRIVNNADVPAREAAVADMVKGHINVEKAAGALYRESDDTLTLARSTVDVLRQQGLGRLSASGSPMEAAQVDNLINQAATGTNLAANSWVRKVLADTKDPNMDIDRAVDALIEVSGRQGTDLIGGKFGDAVINTAEGADEVSAIGRQGLADAEYLQSLFDQGKAWVIRNPETGEGLLTMDADLGKAGALLDRLAALRSTHRGSRSGAARLVINAYDEYERTLGQIGEVKKITVENAARRVEAANGRVEKLQAIPSYKRPDGTDGESLFHGSSSGQIGEGFEPLESGRGMGGINLYGPGTPYTTSDPFTAYTPGYGGTKYGDVAHVAYVGDTPPNILYLEGPLSRQPMAAMSEGFGRALEEFKAFWLEDLRIRGLLPDDAPSFVGGLGVDLGEAAKKGVGEVAPVSDEMFQQYLDEAMARAFDEEVGFIRADAKKMGDDLSEEEILELARGATEGLALEMEDAADFLATLQIFRQLSDNIGQGGKADTLKEVIDDMVPGLDRGQDLGLTASRRERGMPLYTPTALYDISRAQLKNLTQQGYILDAVFRSMNQGIRDMGYTAMKHTGGMVAGGGKRPHEVVVWLDPTNLKATRVGTRHHTAKVGFGQTAADKKLVAIADDENLAASMNLGKILEEARASGVLDDILWRSDQPMLGDMLDEAMAAELGISPNAAWDLATAQAAFRTQLGDITKLRELAGQADETMGRSVAYLGNGLLKDSYVVRRYAEKLLGDTDQAVDDVAELIRVLRRSDGDQLVAKGAHAVKPEIPADRLQALLSGKGQADLVESIVAAKTMREIHAILGPTVEFSGRIPPPILKALADANTRAEVAEVLTKLAGGQFILPQRIGLLGKAAVAGNLGTIGGATAGAFMGGQEQIAADANFGDVMGGILTGAVLGTLVGSGLGSTIGYAIGDTTRKIEDVADAMDLMLAGTRSTTSTLLRARGVDMGRAQAGLGVPQQLAYGMGHSALGRRLARNAGTRMNLNDPTDVYYKLTDYARSLGMTSDETVTVLNKRTTRTHTLKSGKEKKITDVMEQKVVRSQYADEFEYEQAINLLVGQGYKIDTVKSMDDALKGVADMLPNNPARAWIALEKFFSVAEANLLARGLPPEYAKALTNFAKKGQDEFLGTTGAMGQASNHMQMMVNDRVVNLKKGALSEAETWSGHINLPPPEKVTRAVNQLDAMGRYTQLITGAGVLGQVNRNLRRVAGGGEWMKITPELERNVAVRTARALTATLWAPVILLGRPLAFLSRVLGEDQARMTAAGLDSFFHHPWNYMTAILSNWKVFQNTGALRGVASRSIIPDNIITKEGLIRQDVLDNMPHWTVSEEARHNLTIFDRKQAKEQRVFGATTWGTISEDQPKHLEGLATEFRQLVTDPMTRHLARSKATDPVEDTLVWLTSTPQGNRVMNDWARQFDTPDEAAEFMAKDNLRAFLMDQQARMHLKTGGDWIFKIGNSVIDSAGQAIDPTQIIVKGYDRLDDGYTIIRTGDEELLDIVGSGRLRNVKLIDEDGNEYIQESLRIRDHLTEEKWKLIKDELRAKKTTWDRARRADAGYEGHRFPPVVKGTKFDPDAREMKGIVGVWDDAIDRFYDWALGKPTRWFSRQPVMGQHYWERIGMLYPGMTDEMQTVYRSIAQKEGTWKQVSQIADVYEEAGSGAVRTLDNIQVIDTNAKAFSVERTRDILFDLHRQRNFIDGMRVLFPFAGPFVEALEAWGRVFRENPVYVWRRGTQLVDHLWNTADVGDNVTPDPFNTGWFYTDEQTGEERFNYPIIGDFLPRMFDASIPEGGAVPPLGGRARGLNVMFGSEDMTQGVGPEFAGIPLSAINPGIGAMFQMAGTALIRDPEARTSEIFKWAFPFGTPDNVFALLPYNIRKFTEGFLPGTENDLQRNVMDQFGRMVSGGEVGTGVKYEFDMGTPGGVERAMEEAQSRAVAHNRFEGFMRTLLPTTITPEVMVDLPNKIPGFNPEYFVTIEALGEFARDLVSEKGAQWFTTSDGYRMSTEGDYEIATEYMNSIFGTDMFSAELLSLPLTDRAYPRSYTESGLLWVDKHGDVMQNWQSSGSLIMPDYANISREEEEGGEPYSWEAFDAAVDRGDASFFSHDEQIVEIESRLLKMRNRQIDVEATRIYGAKDMLEGEENSELRNQREAYVSNAKQVALGIFEKGKINEAQQTKVFNELLLWGSHNWDQHNLTPEEFRTVEAVVWYLGARQQALGILQPTGTTKLSNVGSSDDEKAMVQAVKADLQNIVAMQLDHAAKNGVDMGNFVYIYETYLKPELTDDDENPDYDPLQLLAEVRSEDDNLSTEEVETWDTTGRDRNSISGASGKFSLATRPSASMEDMSYGG